MHKILHPTHCPTAYKEDYLSPQVWWEFSSICSQDLQIITNSHQAVYLRGPEGASGPRCCEPGFGGAPVGRRPGHWAVVAAQAGPLRPGRPAAVQLLGSADSVLQRYRPAQEVELRKAEQGLVLGVPCLPAKILTLSTATYCIHLMKETGRMRPLNTARQTYSPPAQTAKLSQRSFCCRLSLQNSVLHLGSRSKNGHTCRALSSALALGCSDICEGGAAAGVTAAATSPWPEVSTACGASGEEGTAALAEPFSRATGTAGSDAGGTGMLPGALAGSGDAVFPQQIQQRSLDNQIAHKMHCCTSQHGTARFTANQAYGPDCKTCTSMMVRCSFWARCIPGQAMYKEVEGTDREMRGRDLCPL